MKLNIAALALALTCAAAVPTAAQAPENSFRTRLTTVAFANSAEPTEGDGNVTAAVDGGRIRIQGTFSGLASPARRARLLSGSGVGVPGTQVVADLALSSQATSGTLSGEVAANAATAALLRGQRLYVQLDTAAASEGALWGWLMPNRPFPGDAVPERANWYAR